MLTKGFRDRLATRVARAGRPFLLVSGTDLSMHDIGYLSQVAAQVSRIHQGQQRRGIANVSELRAEDSYAGVERTALQQIRDGFPQEYQESGRSSL